MKFNSQLIRIYTKVKDAKKENAIACSLLFFAGIISLYPGSSFLFHAFTVDGFTMRASDFLMADTIVSLLMMLPSLVLFSTGYLLLESHSMGWKLSLVTSIVAFSIGTLNYLNLELALAIGIASAIAAILEIQNRRNKEIKRKDLPTTVENVAKLGMVISVLFCVAIIVLLIGYVGIRGAPYLNWDFITNIKWSFPHAGAVLNQAASGSMGGILGYAIGSLLVSSFCELIAIPLGLGAAIFLSEYAKQNKLTEIIRFFIETLAGIPSVVIGFLAYVLLVTGTGFFYWGTSVFTAAVALAIMILPWNIRVVEEAMKSVPASYREASFALGATRWETVRNIVLFAASPGIITGLLLGLGAALGETAVLLFAAGFPPTGPQTLPPLNTLFSYKGNFPVLPVFIYRAPLDLPNGQAHIANQLAFNFNIYSVAFAAGFVLIAIYLVICGIALYVRNLLTKKITGT